MGRPVRSKVKTVTEQKIDKEIISNPVRGSSIPDENNRSSSPALNILANTALNQYANEDLEESLKNLFSGFKISDHNER